MSELINAKTNGISRRHHLLATTSALVLASLVAIRSSALAADQSGTDRPTLWIELGGQLDSISGQGAPFAVGFLKNYPDSSVLKPTTPFDAERPIPFSFSETGRLTLQPRGSDWTFSASAIYGRSSNFTHVDHQTDGTFYTQYKYGKPRSGTNIHGTDNFADTQVHHSQSHTILDFMAGKDVGLGLFGKDASSVLSLGVRFAQFSSRTSFDARARPDLEFKYTAIPTLNLTLKLAHFHTYHLSGQMDRSFHGVGPSLSWSGSAPLIGSPDTGQAALDWDLKAAILFGRQKAAVNHHESAHYLPASARFGGTSYQLVYERTGGHSTNRTVDSPSISATAALSWRIENFKMSLGYRADFFFGAMDTGIDARQDSTLGFHGPFATISVGLGG